MTEKALQALPSWSGPAFLHPPLPPPPGLAPSHTAPCPSQAFPHQPLPGTYDLSQGKVLLMTRSWVLLRLSR